MILLIIYILSESVLLVLAAALLQAGRYALSDLPVYLCICLNAAAALTCLVRRRLKRQGADTYRSWLIPAALILTLAADTLLLLLDRYYLAGTLLFCAVQTLYMLHLRSVQKHDAAPDGKLPAHRTAGAASPPVCTRTPYFRKRALIRAFLTAALITAALVFSAVTAGKPDPLAMAAAYSFAFLIMNTAEASSISCAVRDEPANAVRARSISCAVRSSGRDKTESVSCRLFAAGMLLFLCCDICVGLKSLPVPALISDLAFRLNWFFYVPSQALIVLSCILS